MIYRSFLWARNKMKFDDDLSYFLNSELKVEANRPTMINQKKIKMLKEQLKDHTSQELSTIFSGILDGMNLDIAPKFYVICHLAISLLPPNKRMGLSRKLKFKDLSYIPDIKNGVGERYFCEFLSYYAFYLDGKFGASIDTMAIFEEVVDIKKYVQSNVLKGQDVTYLDKSLSMLKQLMMILENFFNLGDYFYIKAKPNRIEGNIIGLVVNDIEKLYRFCNLCISNFEEKLIEVSEKEFALCLFDIYSRFVQFNVRFKRVLKHIESFLDLFLISLPDFYIIDQERNSKLERYFLKLKKEGLGFELREYLKTINLPKNGDLAHIDKNNHLIHQTFFTETGDEDIDNEEFKEQVGLNGGKSVEITQLKRDGFGNAVHNDLSYKLSEVSDEADEDNYEI